MTFSGLFELLRCAATAFSADRAPRLAAALAYYSIFAVVPLLFVLVSIAGQFLAGADVRQALLSAVRDNLGNAGVVDFLKGVLQNTDWQRGSVWATVLGAFTLFFTATGLFAQLQDALNSLWNASPPPINGIWALVRVRLIAFALVLFYGALIIAFLIGNSVLSAYAAPLADQLGAGAFFTRVGTFLLGTALFTVVFASIYKFLPYVQLKWREVWIGAAITATLFTAGQLLIGYYLGRFSPTSVFGAAGAPIVLLLWIYYSGMILFFGAEVTWVYSQQYGSGAGGANKPGKQAAVARGGASVTASPTNAFTGAQADLRPAAPGHPTGLPLRPQPVVGRVFGRALLALLALPALPVVWLIRHLGKR